ncbi:MAG: DNA primase [Clostridia bacterium]|nr:DNA primase [Clostridia bacterium]
MDQRFLDDLFARVDIVSLVSKYVHLTKKGGNHFGLCPFHNEKTPSFSVNGEKQIFHCFGCGVGGGAVQFLMKMENLEFRDAVEQLAQSVGMEVPKEGNPREERRRDRLYELMREAARHFHANLARPEAAAAVEYIRRRALAPQTVTRFGLGYSMDSWDDLSRAMKAKGYSEEELLFAGLTVRGKNNSAYDRFRGRLMFPIIDVRGRVIAFGGRVLDDSLPKYLNSPDTPIFNKTQNLFGLNYAKKSKLGKLILAEGYMDVISLHQAGFDCAVASLGTSLTSDQARIISRYTDKCIISYDADEAGQKAAQRAIQIFGGAGVSVQVLRIPGAKDPDEFIKKNGPEAFNALLSQSEGQTEYRLRIIRQKYDLSHDDQKVAFLREASGMLAGIPNAVERDVFAGRAAEAAGVGKEALLIEVEKRRRADRKKEEAARHREDISPVNRAQPKERELRYRDTASAMAEETLLAVLLQRPEHCGQAKALLQPEDFSSEPLAEIYRLVLAGKGDTVHLSTELSPEKFSLCTKLMMRELPKDEKRAVADCAARIRAEKLKGGAPAGEEDPLLAFRKMKAKK